MSVEYITYQKKKLPIKIGYYTLKMLQQEHGMDFNASQNDLAAYEPMLYYALKQGHKLEGKEFPYKMEDMVDILDECFFEFVEKAANFFPQDLLEKILGEGGKK